ncbi:SH3 domain-containing protein [Deefgea sp. CFH1-16]|uniref:SH3 domain-containing protein n=1 Tax=Deefgea sp. CFH1-16 TaxID=2675457 RepID=UPI0015F429B3|nr:SH3 domain-containing protein [Deefgea sp. CFH1-16]
MSLLAILASGAQAVDYRSTARHGVIVYDAPADTASKRFILSANIPLEMLSEQGDWIRVRDRDGTLSWIKKIRCSRPSLRPSQPNECRSPSGE